MLVRMVNISKQARAFRKGRHAEGVQLALSFYSFACPMTTCSISLTVARTSSHFIPQSRAMAQSVIKLIPEVREAIEDYLDLHEKDKRQFYGAVLLQEAEAHRMLGNPGRMSLLKREARQVLGDEYGYYDDHIRRNEMRIGPPASLSKIG